MIDWNEIFRSHVFDSICDFSYRWWGMRVRFYDRHSDCVSENIRFNNSFCDLMYSCDEGAKSCRQCYRAYFKKLDRNSDRLFAKCHAGLNMIIIPVIVDEEYVGAIIGSGLKLSEREGHGVDMYIKKLGSLGLGDTVIERGYDSLVSLNGSTEEQVNDFLELAVRDIEVNYKLQKDMGLLVKKGKKLQEESYREKYKDIVFVSAAMTEVFDTVETVEGTEKTILIEGETGTGKELLAAAIHYNSLRRDEVFIIQNCSAFNDSLLCSELFGHVKGSFTGAVSDKEGLFQLADEGSLFLDEIGDMSLENQATLLRILENGTYYKLGGTELQRVNVRVLAATNKDLYQQVEKGLFRKDLFYRINAIQITMPPLRNREGDIEPLLYYFLEAYAEAHNTVKKEVDEEVIKLFEAYDWPGNVREFKNQVERLIILSGSNNKIEAKLLPAQMQGDSISVKHERRISGRKTLKDTLKTVERNATEVELKKAKWNKTIASRKLGISRASLNNKIESYNISRCEFGV